VTHCSHCFNVLKNEYPVRPTPPAPLPTGEGGVAPLEQGHSPLPPGGGGARGGRPDAVADTSSWQVLHHTPLLNELLQAGRLKPEREVREVVTFHDSCYLGRYNGEFEAPRAILAALPGVELKEMPRSRENGLCCGGGGGCSWVDVPAARRVPDI